MLIPSEGRREEGEERERERERDYKMNQKLTTNLLFHL
jgi:hypothetical protein